MKFKNQDLTQSEQECVRAITKQLHDIMPSNKAHIPLYVSAMLQAATLVCVAEDQTNGIPGEESMEFIERSIMCMLSDK